MDCETNTEMHININCLFCFISASVLNGEEIMFEAGWVATVIVQLNSQ